MFPVEVGCEGAYETGLTEGTPASKSVSASCTQTEANTVRLY